MSKYVTVSTRDIRAFAKRQRAVIAKEYGRKHDPFAHAFRCALTELEQAIANAENGLTFQTDYEIGETAQPLSNDNAAVSNAR